jgi:hypothetical protein
VRGLGDHVPAFLLRSVTPPPPAPDEDIEDIEDIEDADGELEEINDVAAVPEDAPVKRPARGRTAAAKPRARGRRTAKAPVKKREAKEG